jgi:hypothetical protein
MYGDGFLVTFHKRSSYSTDVKYAVEEGLLN